MKRVFSSHSQCAHVWAQQTQSDGRGANVFFEGPTFYSYGHHYKAAQIHTVKGKRFALINSNSYSVSTSKHLHEVRRAVNGLMPYFAAPDVTNPRTAVEFADQTVKNVIAYQMKRVKIQDKNSIRYAMEMITEAYQSADAIRVLLGRKPLKRDIAAIAGVSKHLHQRLARYNELNPPHVLAARAKEKAEKEASAAREYEAKQAENIAKFRNGLINSVWGLSHELLRVDADRELVQTSAGAEVPLTQAVRLFRALKSGKDFTETKVGGFEFSSIDRTLEDPVISIGCHRIKMSEAQAVLGRHTLALVKETA